MRVRYTASAREDFRAILDFISDRNPQAARRVNATLKEAVASLGQNPRRGRALAWPDGSEKRRLIVGSHLILYEIRDDVVAIVRIVHGARDLETMLRAMMPSERRD